ncbi:MAG TPA: hypothetical protein EYP68_03340 [Candidatus Korarchaeota archaeon]|nr:hypothetical protein [Candidatus Korarchaeota archaeon]
MKLSRFSAEEVMRRTKDALARDFFMRLDVELLKRGINPGTIADLTTSSIFLALIDGLRF